MTTKDNPNFLEISNVNDANIVDISVYRFERYSDKKDAYIFVKRKGQ